MNCGQPPVPKYGQIDQTRLISYGNSIHYSCQNGFLLSGLSNQICQSNGQWSGNIPVCDVLNCTDPGIPINGYRIGTSFLNGSIINFTCTEGYVLNGENSIQCFRGNWSFPTPVCEQDVFCIVTNIENGYIVDDDESSLYNVGDVICYQCQDNSTLVGSNCLQCMTTGQWNSTVPQCTDTPTTATVDYTQFYQLLTAILIVAIIIILLIVACILLILLAYRKSRQQPPVEHQITYSSCKLN